MKHRLLKLSSIVAIVSFLAVFYGLAIINTPESDAAKATDFNPGRIIDDVIFYNANTMTVDEIQQFMDSHLPACDMWGTGSSAGRVVNETGYVMPAGSTNADYARKRKEAGNTRYHEPPYVCVNKYYENPETHETLYETNGIVKEGMLSAAQIIYNEAQKYSINPQVLLVLIKKESYVWGDTWPLKWEYNSVTGYGCPDTAPCNANYYGFYNQVHMAAFQFNRYKEHNYEYNYHPGMVNTIYYSPNYSCGAKQVYIENMATASLYIYTPYVPNDAALANYPGTSYCGSYGNRNFFMYFNEWFGNTYIDNYSDLETPRYFVINKDTVRINPYTGNAAEQSAIAAGTVLKITSKIKIYNDWCFRTEHNTQHEIDACIPSDNLSEIEFDIKASENDNYMIIPKGTKNILINGESEYAESKDDKIVNLNKTITFRGKTYYVDESTNIGNTKILFGYLEDGLTKIDTYEDIDEYLRVTSDTKKVSLTEDEDVSNSVVEFGTLRKFKKHIKIGDNDYYQTEHDNKNSIALYIKGDKLEKSCTYLDFETPRKMKLATTVDRIGTFTGLVYDRLNAGRVIEFSTKVFINGEWYFRTKYNTEHNQDYVIPAKYIVEV